MGKTAKKSRMAAPSDKPGENEEALYPQPRTVKTDVAESLFYFHEVNDYIKGFFLGSRTQDCLNYPQRIYIVSATQVRQDGEDWIIEDRTIVETPALANLRRIINGRELVGSLLRIVYQGKQNRRKAFSVLKDKGTFYTDEQVLDAVRKYKKPLDQATQVQRTKRKRRKKGIKNG